MAKFISTVIISGILPLLLHCKAKPENKSEAASPAPAIPQVVTFDHPAEYRDLSLKLSLSALALLDCHKKSNRLRLKSRYPSPQSSTEKIADGFQVQADILAAERTKISEFSDQLRNFPPPPSEWQEAKNLLIEMLISLEEMSQTMVEDTDQEGHKIVFLKATEDQLNAAGAPFVRAYKRLDLMIPH